MKKILLSFRIYIILILSIGISLTYVKQFIVIEKIADYRESYSVIKKELPIKLGQEWEKTYIVLQNAEDQIHSLGDITILLAYLALSLTLSLSLYLYFLLKNSEGIDPENKLKMWLKNTCIFCIFLMILGFIIFGLFSPIICIFLWVK